MISARRTGFRCLWDHRHLLPPLALSADRIAEQTSAHWDYKRTRKNGACMPAYRHNHRIGPASVGVCAPSRLQGIGVHMNPAFLSPLPTQAPNLLAPLENLPSLEQIRMLHSIRLIISRRLASERAALVHDPGGSRSPVPACMAMTLVPSDQVPLDVTRPTRATAQNLRDRLIRRSLAIGLETVKNLVDGQNALRLFGTFAIGLTTGRGRVEPGGGVVKYAIQFAPASNLVGPADRRRLLRRGDHRPERHRGEDCETDRVPAG